MIAANRFRQQDRDRQDARNRLIDLIREAATPPKPPKPTRTLAAAKRKRLTAKRRQSEIKKTRGKVTDRD